MHLATRAAPIEANSGSSRRNARPAALPITLGPGHAVPHRGWAEARDSLLIATASHPSLTLLLGPAGTGKSLLLQDLAQHRRATGSEVLYQPRGDLPVEAAEPGRANRRRFVLIDEADRMDGAALDRLSRLGKCTVVLAGLAGPRRGHAEAFPKATIVRLGPVPAETVGRFVATRLAQGGWPDDLLTDAAVTRLAVLTGGVPRALNILLSSALFLAGNEAADFVEARHVEQAALLRAGDPDIAVPGLPASFGLGNATADVSGITIGAPRELGRKRTSTPVPLVPRVARGRSSTRRWLPALCAASAIGVTIAALSFSYEKGLWHLPTVPAPAPEKLTSLPVPNNPPVEREAPASAVAEAPQAPPPGPTQPSPIPSTPEAAVAEEPPQPVAQAAPVITAAMPEPPAPPPETTSATPVAPPPVTADIAPQPPPVAAPVISLPVISLPTGAPARVTLRYPPGNAEAAERAVGLAASLRGAGYLVEGRAADLPRDARSGAQYFYAEDRATAEAVSRTAKLAGTSTLAPGSAQGGSAQGGLPRPGWVELLIGPN